MQRKGVMHVGREEDDLSYDLRLLLIGKTGVGKSRTGNIIFNETVFLSELSSSSVTRECQTHSDNVNNRRVTVIDTPDFFYSTNTDHDFNSELKRALDLCAPGAHAVLLLLPLNTFTEQELDFVTKFEQKFGEEVLRYTIVLFTHQDQTHMRSLRAMIRKNNKLSSFLNRCVHGYIEFNINAPSNRQQVSELLRKIDTMVLNNTNTCYSLKMLQENESRAERKTKEISEEHQKDLERVRKEAEKQAKKEIQKLEQAIEAAEGALIREDGQLEQKRVEENTQKQKKETKNTQFITQFFKQFLHSKFFKQKRNHVLYSPFVLLLSGCYFYYHYYY